MDASGGVAGRLGDERRTRAYRTWNGREPGPLRTPPRQWISEAVYAVLVAIGCGVTIVLGDRPQLVALSAVGAVALVVASVGHRLDTRRPALDEDEAIVGRPFSEARRQVLRRWWPTIVPLLLAFVAAGIILPLAPGYLVGGFVGMTAIVVFLGLRVGAATAIARRVGAPARDAAGRRHGDTDAATTRRRQWSIRVAALIGSVLIAVISGVLLGRGVPAILPLSLGVGGALLAIGWLDEIGRRRR